MKWYFIKTFSLLLHIRKDFIEAQLIRFVYLYLSREKLDNIKFI